MILTSTIIVATVFAFCEYQVTNQCNKQAGVLVCDDLLEFNSWRIKGQNGMLCILVNIPQ